MYVYLCRGNHFHQLNVTTCKYCKITCMFIMVHLQLLEKGSLPHFAEIYPSQTIHLNSILLPATTTSVSHTTPTAWLISPASSRACSGRMPAHTQCTETSSYWGRSASPHTIYICLKCPRSDWVERLWTENCNDNNLVELLICVPVW